jgi:hypothetical protein
MCIWSGLVLPFLGFFPLFFGALLKAELEVRTQIWVIYLGSDPRKQEWESRESEISIGPLAPVPLLEDFPPGS